MTEEKSRIACVSFLWGKMQETYLGTGCGKLVS